MAGVVDQIDGPCSSGGKMSKEPVPVSSAATGTSEDFDRLPVRRGAGYLHRFYCGRSSTMNGRPSRSASHGAIRRVTMSPPLPAAPGTISRTGRVGYGCARAMRDVGRERGSAGGQM